MNLTPLTAISPIDGRYRNQVENLVKYFSEHALIYYRLWVEVEYFIALCELPLPQLESVDKKLFPKLRNIYSAFSEKDANAIKEIELITNHDVKAVEYFIKKKFEELGLDEHKEFIHFGLTSQDINNTAIPASLRDAIEEEFVPQVDIIVERLMLLAKEWKSIPLLARTHGQPASPTILGKEVYVFVERLDEQLERLEEVPVCAKFGGATGNFNAHHVAFPQIDWIEFANNFVFEKLELTRSVFTTQIEHYDNLAALFDAMKRINTILIDLCRDIWAYVSLDYFKQKVKEGEVGSSAMPHKVNPIDFENAEGNLGFANALFEHLSAKLPISRLQRDLTDSTVLRNIGVPFAHTMIALYSIEKGLEKLELNESKIREDLDSNWAVVTEAIQTILRREGYPKPYEALKSLTRGKLKITKEDIHSFIETLKASDALKTELKKITPQNYTGIDILSKELDEQ
ncbi:MAG: adenylosuccinate lyase [Flavobacteriales bacterium]|nr:adenylosuccinate lyase [Flavobacteriales bacterium]